MDRLSRKAEEFFARSRKSPRLSIQATCDPIPIRVCKLVSFFGGLLGNSSMVQNYLAYSQINHSPTVELGLARWPAEMPSAGGLVGDRSNGAFY
jgi:hypothetical protein